MKKYIPAIIAGLVALAGSSQAQTFAPSIVATDCSGVTHNLQDKLNSGKIIVIGWTMPCATCKTPLQQVHTAVGNFNATNPGAVEYWVADDYANSSCTSVSSWSTTNGITNAHFFSTAALRMLDFGSNGMPKVVVIGCSNRKVYYNVNDNPTGTGVTSALNTVMGDINSGCLSTVGLPDLQGQAQIKLFPNPAKDKLSVTLPSGIGTAATITITNSLGQVVSQKQVAEADWSALSLDIDISRLPASLYFVSLETSSGRSTQSFVRVLE